MTPMQKAIASRWTWRPSKTMRTRNGLMRLTLNEHHVLWLDGAAPLLNSHDPVFPNTESIAHCGGLVMRVIRARAMR